MKVARITAAGLTLAGILFASSTAFAQGADVKETG